METNAVVRIHLKTGDSEQKNNYEFRKKLIEFCLENRQEQYVAIGWSSVYKNDKTISTYEDYYRKVKANGNRINAAHNIFLHAKKDDLFWTRDLNGFYWICRARSSAKAYYNPDLDIGAVVPVEAFKYGLEVPGGIKASFNRPNGGTANRFHDHNLIEFSKFVYNELSRTNYFQVNSIAEDIISNLPDFDLEELVISYIQIKYNYYVLSNSIAKKSTTIAIECEFISKDVNDPMRAVVQVKGGKDRQLKFGDYTEFLDRGYQVFLYAPKLLIDNCKPKNIICIDSNDLKDFYYKYKNILPSSITKWEKIIN